ncbi:MAG: crossover junction endodeoxyribonuclease RuvC [Lentisphaeria bacterium]|nr:crossover junction endodeoxyribonuclease RuvC [Lentisphaeria bacterium]
MRILGVDTALRCSGYGVVDCDAQGKLQIVDCGFIKTPAKKPVSECLRRLSGGISHLLKTYKPDVVAIEGTFFNKFARSAMLLGMARGAVVGVVALDNLEIFEYAPKTAKKAVTGRGEASKEQVAFMMSHLFKIKVNEIPLDATDALSIAVCHFQHANSKTIDLNKFKL